MELLLTVLLFVIGLAIIIKGGDFMVDSSLRLSKITGISHIIIGVTVVSICTTLPELLVNIIGVSTGKSDLAVGNAVGSIICDCTLVLGVVLTCTTQVISRKSFWFKSSLFVISTVLLFIFGLNTSLELIEALIMFAIFIFFFTVNVVGGIKEAKLEAHIESHAQINNLASVMPKIEEEEKDKVVVNPYNPLKDVITTVILAIAGLITLIITPIYYTDDMISPFGIVVLGIVFVLYIVQAIFNIKQKTKFGDIEEDTSQLKDKEFEEYKKSPQRKKDIIKTVFYFILGGLMVYIGATLLCDDGQKLAVDFLGVDPIIVGITVVALGTSLPELVTAIISIKKKTPGLALGNMIGASFINVTLILGTSGIISNGLGTPLGFSLDTLYISLPFTIAVSLIIFIPTIIKQKTYRWQGITLLTLYVADYIYLFATLGNLLG